MIAKEFWRSQWTGAWAVVGFSLFFYGFIVAMAETPVSLDRYEVSMLSLVFTLNGIGLGVLMRDTHEDIRKIRSADIDDEILREHLRHGMNYFDPTDIQGDR